MDFRVEIAETPEDTDEGRKFRQQVRDFLDRELTPEVLTGIKESKEPAYFYASGFRRTLIATGWVSTPPLPGWSKEYGRVERSPEEMRVLGEELAARGLSSSYGDIGNSAQGAATILNHGSEELKREILPKLARGEMSFALGYTEPNAGTDLASLEMRAVRDGDEYVINGQKVYSGGAHIATHHWLLTRTDPDMPKHRGMSIFVVDLKTPGITVRPLVQIDGGRCNEVFYDDVRVSAKYLVGEENMGWSYAREALAYERMYMGEVPATGGGKSPLIQYVKETERNGRPLSEDPFVRQSLARLAVEASISRLFNHRVGWVASKGNIPEVEGAISKVWVGEAAQRSSNIGTQILGLYGQLEPGSKWVPLGGSSEIQYRSSVMLGYGGGSNELLRSLIATRGMGLPRDPR